MADNHDCHHTATLYDASIRKAAPILAQWRTSPHKTSDTFRLLAHYNNMARSTYTIPDDASTHLYSTLMMERLKPPPGYRSQGKNKGDDKFPAVTTKPLSGETADPCCEDTLHPRVIPFGRQLGPVIAQAISEPLRQLGLDDSKKNTSRSVLLHQTGADGRNGVTIQITLTPAPTVNVCSPEVVAWRIAEQARQEENAARNAELDKDRSATENMSTNSPRSKLSSAAEPHTTAAGPSKPVGNESVAGNGKRKGDGSLEGSPVVELASPKRSSIFGSQADFQRHVQRATGRGVFSAYSSAQKNDPAGSVFHRGTASPPWPAVAALERPFAGQLGTNAFARAALTTRSPTYSPWRPPMFAWSSVASRSQAPASPVSPSRKVSPVASEETGVRIDNLKNKKRKMSVDLVDHHHPKRARHDRRTFEEVESGKPATEVPLVDMPTLGPSPPSPRPDNLLESDDTDLYILDRLIKAMEWPPALAHTALRLAPRFYDSIHPACDKPADALLLDFTLDEFSAFVLDVLVPHIEDPRFSCTPACRQCPKAMPDAYRAALIRRMWVDVGLVVESA